MMMQKLVAGSIVKKPVANKQQTTTTKQKLVTRTKPMAKPPDHAPYQNRQTIDMSIANM
jgi:hypothetical protein